MASRTSDAFVTSARSPSSTPKFVAPWYDISGAVSCPSYFDLAADDWRSTEVYAVDEGYEHGEVVLSRTMSPSDKVVLSRTISPQMSPTSAKQKQGMQSSERTPSTTCKTLSGDSVASLSSSTTTPMERSPSFFDASPRIKVMESFDMPETVRRAPRMKLNHNVANKNSKEENSFRSCVNCYDVYFQSAGLDNAVSMDTHEVIDAPESGSPEDEIMYRWNTFEEEMTCPGKWRM